MPGAPIDWIPLLSVVLIVVITVWLGIWATRMARTASDFFVAGRSVNVFWNASAISGEYLSAASFMGVAGLLMKHGYDVLWYPVCYAAGYLFLLLFIAGPLRRFGAYTIPDFAEGRFDSPRFRKIAVTFVLFIGFFYTMPQMKGAGITMAQILGWEYWVGIVMVGTVITFNVALGGMKGITFVQAFQYWAKMFAISAPVFVLMTVFGGYGGTLGGQAARPRDVPTFSTETTVKIPGEEKAPVNAIAFGPGETTFQLPKGAEVKSAGPRRKPKPGEDPMPPGQFLNPMPSPGGDGILGSYPAGAVVTAMSPTVTEGGIPHVDGGSRVRTSARIEFKKATEVTFGAGESVPDSPANVQWLHPFGSLTSKWGHPVLYTYSLILALVCGTAGLPHILVRFYTNPDGRAAKRTTLWVMVLIGTFYLFPPIWGALGRAVMPTLYLAGQTDRAVIALPGALENKLLGQILIGITSAGAFAAFMSTFSGLLVSMSGALAHDIYGKMIRPSSTPQDRLKAFKVAAVLFGGIAMVLGYMVETFDINMMVGWAFAIAAASYFPLLLMGSWWKGLTKYGAAAGMLSGGLLSLSAIVAHMLLDKKWLTLELSPITRTLLEQPAIWGVPLALTIMYVVSKLTSDRIPRDINMKMLRLHAPEEMGLSRNYIEH
jgi:Na+(H+)/acetate symporter ActP